LSARRAAAGFAFTEVLFAVMVLGIGFIMIAAMFPVTIRQTQSTVEETVGAQVARGALDYMQSVAADDLFPPTAKTSNDIPGVLSLSSSQAAALYGNYKGLNQAFLAVRGNMVSPDNPRIAWIPMYRRGADPNSANIFPKNGLPYAQVFILVVQSRNRDQYLVQPADPGIFPDRDYSDLDPPFKTPTAFRTLEPKLVAVGVRYDDLTGHGEVTIDPAAKDVAAPGAYLIIASDPNKNPPAPSNAGVVGQSNGRIYRLGNAIDEAAGIWELDPSADMIRGGPDPKKPIPGDDYDLPADFTPGPKTTYAYIVGRGYTDPHDANQGYSGPGQDIALYTGFIQIPPGQ
jgi:hypothetical protein